MGLLEKSLTPRARPCSHSKSYPRLWGAGSQSHRNDSPPRALGDKSKFKSLEVDFLVVNVPTTYNVIIRRLTLYRVKAVVAPCLLQLQFETDDGSVGELHGDQRTARECYLVSIKSLIERTRECGTSGPLLTGKRANAGLATLVPEALVIHTLVSSEPL